MHISRARKCPRVIGGIGKRKARRPSPAGSMTGVDAARGSLCKSVISRDRLLPSFGSYEEEPVPHGASGDYKFFRSVAAAAGGCTTDRLHESLSDADLRNLARLISACTLGLWAFAAGLLIGTFLFS
jgi:hypothetical protein